VNIFEAIINNWGKTKSREDVVDREFVCWSVI